MAATPTLPGASRPHAPGYQIVDASSGQGLLPWSWAAERLAAPHDDRVASVCPDGRPHAMPVSVCATFPTELRPEGRGTASSPRRAAFPGWRARRA